MNALYQVKRLISITLVVFMLHAPVVVSAAAVVDINRATAATMIENWKGIGEKKARAIVSYRKKNGSFKSINDLANVKGIGEGLIKQNRKYMSLTKGLSKPSGKSTANKSSKDKKSSSTTSKSKSKDTKSKTTGKDSSSKKSTAKSSIKKSKKPDKKKSTSKKSKKNCKANSKDKNCKKKSTKKTKKKKSSK